MIDTVTQYIKDNTTPELADDLQAAHVILEKMNVLNLDTSLEAFLFEDEMVNPGDTMHALVEATRAFLHDVLKQHTITFSEDTDIDTLTQLLVAIGNIPDFEDKDSIVRLCSSELKTNEVFCEIVSLVIGRQIEEFLPHVENVGEALIKKIRDMCTVGLPFTTDGASQEARMKYIDDFKFYLNYLMQQPLLITDFLKDGMATGYPFISYAEMIGRGLESMFPLRAAQELVGMAIVSSDGNANPRLTIVNTLEHYISSVNFTTAVLIEVDKLLAGYKR